MKNKIFYIIVALLVVGSCKNTTSKSTLKFNVQKELLSTISYSLSQNLYFNIPLDFENVSVNSLDDLKKVGLDSISNLPLLNHKFYFNKKDKSIIITSQVDKDYKNKLILSKTLEYSKNKQLWEKVSSTEYVNNGLSFNQFLLQNKSFIVFKLLVEKNKRTSEVNYIIPKENYTEEMARKIESSIGSIK